MAQPLPLGPQGAPPRRVEPGRVDRRHQLLQVGPLALGGRRAGARAAVRARSRPPEPPAQRPQALGARHGRRAREGVEHRELAGRAHQPPVLVLGREAHQGTRQRRDGLARRGLPVDQRPRAALGRDAAREDDLALVLGQLAQRRAPGRRPRAGPRTPPARRGWPAPARGARRGAPPPRRPARRPGGPSACASTVLPAPVSPVIAVRPAGGASSARSMTTRSRTSSERITAGRTSPGSAGRRRPRGRWPGGPPSRPAPIVTERPGPSAPIRWPSACSVAVADQRAVGDREGLLGADHQRAAVEVVQGDEREHEAAHPPRDGRARRRRGCRPSSRPGCCRPAPSQRTVATSSPSTA